MRRETTNKIRYVLEEWVPPILRDSRFMRVLFRQPWGHITDDFERLRVHITELSPDDYRHVYERMPRLQEDTDNSQDCLDEIAARAIAGKICDVGCGTGYLIRLMSQQPALANSQFWGADFIVGDEVRS